MLPINADTLYAIAPRFSGATAAAQKTIVDAIGPLLVPTLTQYAIDTPLRIAHFLGQCCEESAGFRTLTEFASGDAYEFREDLGNVYQGDGRKYKGRGLIQLTGSSNYARVGKVLGLDLVNKPELAATPRCALEIACVFWDGANLNSRADLDDLMTITRIINGGTNGLAERRAYTTTAKNVLARLSGVQRGAIQTGAMVVLHRGLTGDAVETLQRDLQTLGYKITIDGDFGPGTEKVVEMFQETTFGNDPVHVDGIVDVETWRALTAAIETLNHV